MATINSFSPNTRAESSKVNTNFTNINSVLRPSFGFGISGGLSTGENQTLTWIVPQNMTIIKCYGYLKTAPTGATLIVDINVNGTSIWDSTQASRLTFAVSNQSTSQTSFDNSSLSEGDILTLDVDQVGSTIAGSDLTVVLKCSV